MKKIGIIITTIVLVLTLSIITWNKISTERKIKQKQQEEKEKLEEIKNSFQEVMITKQETNLYKKTDEETYKEYGKIGENITLLLEENKSLSLKYPYFKIKDKDIYITYEAVEKSERKEREITRYDAYVMFNENVKIKENTPFLKNGKKIFEVNETFDLPIIKKEDNFYVIKYLDDYYEIGKEHTEEIYENQNTDIEAAEKIPALLYHFFYEEGIPTDTSSQNIALSTKKLEEQLQYLKENEYITLKMAEVSDFIDGKIRLPKKSVVLTIDDGDPTVYNYAYPLIEKYQVNATVFAIMVAYTDAINHQTEYVEIHSHGYNLHQGGCPGGQGGLIKCIEEEKGLEDLRKSREMLNNSNVFSYPFGEYTNYSIELLKKAGFELAVTTRYGNITKETNKLLIPRKYIYKNQDLNTFIQLLTT